MKTKLELLIEKIDVNGGMIFNSEGVLFESYNLDYPGNISAMSAMILNVSKELFENSNLGKVNELILKADQGLFFIKHINQDEWLTLFTEDLSKMGLIHLSTQNLDFRNLES
ncbi:roadblock/LC7 domain-containing protein [Flavobacterium luminosum]|uniref:Roadblock/LC7 domain-containing protein n=1 Tax=Flavobacterium luminosum TaxID=2949086 RepID=A0ABT0TRS6_9FLAO|nr:hypothetical protein [Flavobacterium sp. HXWNR70]MCL9809578.1 hypothetical protein [Flavobacterium sp. HXWNR70]